MANILYSVTGPSLDGVYGISGKDHDTGERIVVMHFLESRTDAALLAERITQVQMPIPEFCQAALNGELTNSDWLKSPG